MGRLVGASRYVFVIAVAALLVLAVILIIYGTVEAALAVADLLTAPEFEGGGTKEVTLRAIEIVDVFLLGVAVFLLGTGIFSLVVGTVDLPEPLRAESLGEMKGILASTIVVVLGVAYLGVLLREGEGFDKGVVGLGTAAVIASLTYYVRKPPKP